MPVRPEYLGGETHFLEGRIHQLQVGLFIVLLAGLQRGQNQLAHDLRPPNAAHHPAEGGYGVIRRTVGGREMKLHGLIGDGRAVVGCLQG